MSQSPPLHKKCPIVLLMGHFLLYTTKNPYIDIGREIASTPLYCTLIYHNRRNKGNIDKRKKKSLQYRRI